MENLFIEMWDRCDIDSDGYMQYDNQCYFHQDYKNKYLWCDYKLVYIIFIKQFNIDDKDWGTFVKNMLYKHTNCKGLTPHNGGGTGGFSGINIPIARN
jgi:hypothetical protein